MTQTEEVQDNLPQSTITIEDAGAARKRIKIEVPEERVKAKIEEAFGELEETRAEICARGVSQIRRFSFVGVSGCGDALEQGIGNRQ